MELMCARSSAHASVEIGVARSSRSDVIPGTLSRRSVRLVSSCSRAPFVYLVSRTYAPLVFSTRQAIMKRLFSKTFKLAPEPKPAQPAGATAATTEPPGHHTGLQPKDVLPPVPHPCPYEYISILATTEGILLRPRHPGRVEDASESEVRIEWGKGGKVETLSPGAVKVNWEESVVVYGILGLLEVYSGAYSCAQ